MTKLKVNLHHTRDKILEKFGKSLDEGNKLWYGTIRLIITLSSSFLILTLAVAKQLFPDVTVSTDFSYYLITSWIALFLAIILGIVTELDASIFHGNSGKEASVTLKEIDGKLSQGLDEDIVELPKSYFINATIFWGAASINSFIIAIICICLSFLEEIHFPFCFKTLIANIFLLICLNIHLIKKRMT